MPFIKCVSCGQNGRTKLLKCLHSVCFSCLEKNLTRINEVRCPDCTEVTPSPGEGKHQLLSLPDSHAPGSVSGERADDGEQLKQAVLLCDECHNDEAAVSNCADCKLLLCELHATAHSRNRTTYQHHVHPLSATAQRAETDELPASQALSKRRCIIHPHWTLHNFCCECNDFLCELCVKSGHDPGHCVMSVEDAVAMMRSRVEASVASRSAATATADGNGDFGSVAIEAVESVSNTIKELHSRTESVSDQVQQYFNGIVELVKAREAVVLDDLDRLRTAKLLPLEEQKLRLQKSQTTQEIVCSLLSSCDDQHDFLRMAGWLEEAASNANATAEKYRKPCVVTSLAFIPGDKSKLATAIAEEGGVTDAADIDISRTFFRCAPTVQVNRDLCMQVEAVNHSGQVVSPKIIAMTSLKVVVLSPNADSEECQPAVSSDGKHLISTYRPAVTGKHCLTVKHGDHHVSGSPAEVMVMPEQCTFNPDRCHGDIQLSNGNGTARKTNCGGNRSVCGAGMYKTGRVELRIRLDTVGHDGNVRIFLYNSTNPSLDTYRRDDTAWGWWGYHHNRGMTWRGSQLGQPWQSGDVIRLSLDCDRHTLTGCHERTGTTETLSDVHGDLYLYVCFYWENDQVTLL